MKVCERQQGNETQNFPADGGESSSVPVFQPQIVQTSSLSIQPARPPTSPPLPGILKAARVKHAH